MSTHDEHCSKTAVGSADCKQVAPLASHAEDPRLPVRLVTAVVLWLRLSVTVSETEQLRGVRVMCIRCMGWIEKRHGRAKPSERMQRPKRRHGALPSGSRCG